MFDVDDLVEDGYDLGSISNALEHAMQGLSGLKSKEAQCVYNILEGMHDEVECYE